MTDRHQQKPYPLRMPDELRTRLEHAAVEGSRSLHAEIVARLQASFTPSIATPNVKFSGVDGLGDADMFEQAASKLDHAALTMQVAHFAFLNERYGGLMAELSAVEAQSADLQQLVMVMERELDAIDGDTDAIAHKRLEMQVGHQRSRLRELRRRITELRSAIERTEEDRANALRAMRAKPSAAE